MKKRIICFSVAATLLLASAVGRIGYISLSGVYTVSTGYNSYVLNLEKVYPTVYYSDFQKMTNNKNAYVAVLRPNERTLADLHNLFHSYQITDITNELKEGYPIIKPIEAEKKSEAKYIDVYKINASEYPSAQLLSANSNGLLAHLNPYLNRKISFSIDAKGRLLQGDRGNIYDENISSEHGITLTINKDIEKIVYGACQNLKSGCAVVMSVEDSSILACITKPDSSYVNKAFQQYSVGSVFKIIVAACALENNIDFYYTCSGKTKVGDTEFSCQKNHIHGFENLKNALSNSCNCYFVNLALELGKNKLLKTAEEFGFSDEIALFKEWKIQSATLPEKELLNSKGELALFGFGQGKLISTPLQICNSVCTIANEGYKNQVKLVLSTVNENGDSKKLSYKEAEKILSSKSSKELIKYLRFVVTNGTGYNAETSAHKSAGKTATAQTGQFISNRELLNTWFAGFYPYDNPKYAIVVMAENGKSGAEDCCPIYRTIVENLENL